MIDYRWDGDTTATAMLLQFSRVPYSLQQEYLRLDCFHTWMWFYYYGMKPWPPADCDDLWVKAVDLVDYRSMYDLREILKQPGPP